MMSPLEYLFVMMMRANHPDPETMNQVEPASGQASVSRDPLMINKGGHIEMRTILMEPRDATAEKLEAPLRIMPQWEPMFKIGSPIAITIDESGKTYNAKVSRIETIKDESGQSMQVIAEMTKSDVALQPGQTATAMITSAMPNN